jgi:hypothetical protein
MSPYFPRLGDMHFGITRRARRLSLTFLACWAVLSLSAILGRSDSHRVEGFFGALRGLDPEDCPLELPVVGQVFAL